MRWLHVGRRDSRATSLFMYDALHSDYIIAGRTSTFYSYAVTVTPRHVRYVHDHTDACSLRHRAKCQEAAVCAQPALLHSPPAREHHTDGVPSARSAGTSTSTNEIGNPNPN